MTPRIGDRTRLRAAARRSAGRERRRQPADRRQHVPARRQPLLPRRPHAQRRHGPRGAAAWRRASRCVPTIPSLKLSALSGGNAQKVLIARWMNRSPVAASARRADARRRCRHPPADLRRAAQGGRQRHDRDLRQFGGRAARAHLRPRAGVRQGRVSCARSPATDLTKDVISAACYASAQLTAAHCPSDRRAGPEHGRSHEDARHRHLARTPSAASTTARQFERVAVLLVWVILIAALQHRHAAVVPELGQFLDHVRVLCAGCIAGARDHHPADRGRLRPLGRRDADAVGLDDRRAQRLARYANPARPGDRSRHRACRRPASIRCSSSTSACLRWSSRSARHR